MKSVPLVVESDEQSIAKSPVMVNVMVPVVLVIAAAARVTVGATVSNGVAPEEGDESKEVPDPFVAVEVNV